MANELELKFALAPNDTPAVDAHPLLAAAQVSEAWLENRYFDTPDGALQAQHWALRLRGSDGQWWQTLKGRGSVRDGVHRRSEWECPLDGPQLSLEAFDAHFGPASTDPMPTAVRVWLSEVFASLQPQFCTHFRRRAWLVPLADGCAEVALDIGEVRVDDADGQTLASEPIHELEIEQIDCSETALHDFARRLTASLPLAPSSLSKAQRGLRLQARLLEQADAQVRSEDA